MTESNGININNGRITWKRSGQYKKIAKLIAVMIPTDNTE